MVCALLVMAWNKATWGTAGHSTCLDRYLRDFEANYQTARTLRADFTQAYTSNGKRRVESGTVVFARGGLMRWEYRRPREKLFLSDGKQLLLYVPEERQLTRARVKSSEDVRVPFRLLLSRPNLRRLFSRLEFADEALRAVPGDRVLSGFPQKGGEADYRKILMELTPTFDIRRLVVTSPDESTIEFTFEHIERNIPIAPGLFRFIPPAGTEVIDER